MRNLMMMAASGNRGMDIQSLLFGADEQGVWLDPSDMSTMFQDSAGTTPVTDVGQPLGLILDKSQGLVLGDQQLLNSDFSDGGTGWSLGGGSGWSFSGGQAIKAASGVTQALFQPIAGIQEGQFFEILIDVGVITGGTFTPQIYGGTAVSGVPIPVGFAGVHKVILRAQSEAAGFRLNNSSSSEGVINSIEWRIIPGHHAIQATAANRPILSRISESGRRNLFIATAGPAVHGQGGWFNMSSAAIYTPNAAIAPDGTLTASKIGAAVAGAGFETRHIASPSQTVFANQLYTASIYVKAAGRSEFRLDMHDMLARFNLTSGTLISTSTASAGVVHATSIISIGSDGWYRVSVTASRNADSGGMFGDIGTPITNEGEINDGFYVWGHQIEMGEAPTQYQTVNSIYDIYEPGVDDIYYLYLNYSTQKLTVTLPALNGTVIVAGTLGIWIDEINHPGGAFDLGPNLYTSGPVGMLQPIIGNVIGLIVVEGTLTQSTINKVVKYYKDLGAPGLWELGSELVSNGTFDTNIDGWSAQGSAVIGWNADLQSITVERISSAVDRAAITVPHIAVGDNILVTAQRVSGTAGYSIRIPGELQSLIFEANNLLQRVARSSTEGATAISIAPNSNVTLNFDNISVKKLELIP
jgi:hypothetical protein